MNQWTVRFNRIDRVVVNFMAAYGILFLRISLGIVFLWFGFLKFFPNLSPAEQLAAETINMLSFGLIPHDVARVTLAAWECLIGLGLLFGRFLRVTLLLLFLQMIGTVSPSFSCPTRCSHAFPYAPTLEGQYIIKNIVLVSAAMVIGATVRGGKLMAEPAPPAPESPSASDPEQ